jgi:predicted transcriptional regulator
MAGRCPCEGIDKEGIYERDGVYCVVGPRYVLTVAQALASETRLQIIQLLQSGLRSLDEISEELGQSKANISNQIKRLEDEGIVYGYYEAGKRGIKKFVQTRFKAAVLALTPEGLKAACGGE